MRATLRRRIPLPVRQRVAAARRALRDLRTGFRPERARAPEDWPTHVHLGQAVRPGADAEMYVNKVHNLDRACRAIDGAHLAPGGAWSYWALVGEPSTRRGYADGRCIVEAELVRKAGGGLCQVSGLLYHLALMGALEVLERHPHSIDLYRDEDRVTPLGADATVVWGYKDLRLRNPHPFPVAIRVWRTEDTIEAALAAPVPLPAHDVRFEREPSGPGRARVHTVRDGQRLGSTEYLLRPGMRLGDRA
jgi:vancomycin resistance protein VanW